MKKGRNKQSRRDFFSKTIPAAIGAIGGVGLVAQSCKPADVEEEKISVLTQDDQLVQVSKSTISPVSSAEARKGIPGKQFVMVIDLSRCKNARKCVTKCQKMHDLPPEDEWIKVLLKKIRTNKKGQAIFTLDNNPKIIKDSTRLMSFVVEYEGNSLLKKATRKIAVKQADLQVSFFQKDTTKFIEIEAKSANPNTQPSPVKGTFSLLNFANEKTDKNGKIKIEFPVYMPGDTSGELTIVAKIEEDDVYGTVESKGNINWGIPVPLVKEKKRGLGDTDAPLWMVYTLIALLSAVWFHYLYVIFMIIKIKLAKT